MFVVGNLQFPSTGGFIHRMLHLRGDRIGVHDDFRIDMAGSSAERLDKAGFTAKEPGLVGIEDAYQRDLREIQPFAEQVDSDKHVELSET